MQELSKGEHCKEVYAYFGLALYRAQCVEQSIIQLLIFGNFFPDELPKFKSRAEWEERYDIFESKLLSKTMGQLLKILKNNGIVDIAFNSNLDLALKKRNFLAHTFFVYHAQNFVSFAGRDMMIEKLERDIELFNQVEDFLNPITMKLAQKYGLSQEQFDKYYNDLLKEAESKDM